MDACLCLLWQKLRSSKYMESLPAPQPPFPLMLGALHKPLSSTNAPVMLSMHV